MCRIARQDHISEELNLHQIQTTAAWMLHCLRDDKWCYKDLNMNILTINQSGVFTSFGSLFKNTAIGREWFLATLMGKCVNGEASVLLL